MSEHTGDSGAGGPAIQPVVDLVAVLAALQDQIDDLRAVVDRQQQTIAELLRERRPARDDPTGPSLGRR